MLTFHRDPARAARPGGVRRDLFECARRMLRGVAVVCVIGSVLAAPLPAGADLKFADTEILRPIFTKMLGDPPAGIYMDVVPDIYEGGYARISLYARNVNIKGMHIDEIWIRLVGASFDPELLHQGTLKVLDVRGSAVYGKLDLASIQDFLAHESPVQEIKLFLQDDSVIGDATIVYNGIPTRVRMQGIFQVYGAPEVFFHIQNLIVNSLPVPYVIVDRLERDLNPVVDFRTWPVQFKIRSIRQTPDGVFILSSQADYSQPCNDCGGPQIQLRP
jgi:hypothetical protein